MQASGHLELAAFPQHGSPLRSARALLLAGPAVISTRKLRAAVLRPLDALVDAAGRIGSGDFHAKVASQAEGELGLVAKAFDRMAEELIEGQRRLIAHERMAAIGQLAAGVAHEINDPIAVIRGYLRTMIGRANGTGLVLAVCDGIARAHQGTIEARPRCEGGTEFVVTLPRSEAASHGEP